ncbi:GtrA family protein [Desulfococcus sp.]|uniref:GtrA family protein n=1 Tax=Desulfococcus sp. TaxID=2025834 RepID=UPI003593894E
MWSAIAVMRNFAHNFDNSFYRFVIVGISNTVISYIVFMAAYYLLFVNNASISQCFSYGAGIAWSFHWNRKWTFKSHDKAVRNFILFLILQSVMLLLSVYMIHVLVDVFNNNPTVSWVFVMAGITVINYAANRYWVFR